MSNFDFFGRTVFSMNGFTQLAPPLSVGPAFKGPPPYGIWPVSFTPEAVAEQQARELGQAGPTIVTVPDSKQADLFGVMLGLASAGAGIYMGMQPGPQTVKRYLAPGAAAVAGLALLAKSL